jgi:hypothetical protein
MPFGTRQECKKNLLSWPLHFRKCSKETNINVNDLPKCKFKNNYKVCGVSQRSATTAFVSISKKNTSCKSDIFRKNGIMIIHLVKHNLVLQGTVNPQPSFLPSIFHVFFNINIFNSVQYLFRRRKIHQAQCH